MQKGLLKYNLYSPVLIQQHVCKFSHILTINRVCSKNMVCKLLSYACVRQITCANIASF